MSFLAHLIADLLDLPAIPIKILREGRRIFFLIMLFVSPATVAYGIQLYAQHESVVMQHQLQGVIDRAMENQKHLTPLLPK